MLGQESRNSEPITIPDAFDRLRELYENEREDNEYIEIFLF